MTRLEATNIIADRLGSRTGYNTKIVNELKLAQTRLEHSPSLPWFLLVESSGFATGTTPGTTALPTGFLREHEDEGMLLSTSDGEWVELEKIDGVDGRITEISLSAGQPKYYSLFEDHVRFWPDPDISYPLFWPHYAKAATLDADATENAWLKHHPDVLICSAGIQVARHLRDQQAIAIFSEDLRIALASMHQDTTARREAGRRAYMGG